MHSNIPHGEGTRIHRGITQTCVCVCVHTDDRRTEGERAEERAGREQGREANGQREETEIAHVCTRRTCQREARQTSREEASRQHTGTREDADTVIESHAAGERETYGRFETEREFETASPVARGIDIVSPGISHSPITVTKQNSPFFSITRHCFMYVAK